MPENSITLHPAGTPLNELGKLFFSWEQLGFCAMLRVRFEFKGGHIDVQLLRQAYAVAVKRWPVLNSTIVDNKSGHGWDLRWLPRNVIEPQKAVRFRDFSDLSQDTVEDKIRGIQFDPFMNYSSVTDPPFFMVLCKVPDGRHTLLVFIHHAVTDGYGLSLIFHELFTAYNHSAAGHTADDSKRDNAGTAPSPLLPESWKKRFIQVLGALFFLSGLYIKSRAQSPVI